MARALTCDETLVLQLPEEHGDLVQVRQGRLGVFQHRPLLFLLEAETERGGGRGGLGSTD